MRKDEVCIYFLIVSFDYFLCVQKIFKLENQNKELREQKETLEIKLQEKTEEMKGTIISRSFKGAGESCKVSFTANVNVYIYVYI